jgi:hypothetical protein
MSWLYDTVDLVTFGINPGQITGNIALQGCFDFPERIGATCYEWGDEAGVEPYVEDDELFYAGRDINFQASIFGSRPSILVNLQSLYSLVNSAASGTRVFSTPYGDFNVYSKNITPAHTRLACTLTWGFREPVINLTGGSIQAAGASAYQIDGVPMTSYGLYVSSLADLLELPELKDQHFTAFEVEGFQLTKRKANKLSIDGLIIGTSLAAFQTHIRNLFALYSASGTRQININNELLITCFPEHGFKVDTIYVGSFVIAKFKSDLTIISIT